MLELERHMASTALLDGGVGHVIESGGGGGGGGAKDAVGNGNMRRAALAAHELQTSDEVEELCAALALAVREVEETHGALERLERLRRRDTGAFKEELDAAAARYVELERSSSSALKAERRRCARLEAQLHAKDALRGDAAALVQRVRTKVKAARSASSPTRRSPSLTRSLTRSPERTLPRTIRTKTKKKKKAAAAERTLPRTLPTSPGKKKKQNGRTQR